MEGEVELSKMVEINDSIADYSKIDNESISSEGEGEEKDNQQEEIKQEDRLNTGEKKGKN
jgi:hypothetical protein